jgi:hypothetical protein
MDEAAFAPLDWPGKTVRLERDSVQQYCQRPASAQPPICELFHENSKLFPAMMEELAATRVDVKGVRLEFLSRRAALLRDIPAAEIDDCWRELIGEIARIVSTDLFYAIELRLAWPGALLSYEPVSNRFALVKRLGADEFERLRVATRLLTPSTEPLESALLVVASLARNAILFGSRGYRRTLIEAGRIIEATLGAAARLGRRARPHLEFADRAIDQIIEADGIEESVVAVIELGNSSHVR